LRYAGDARLPRLALIQYVYVALILYVYVACQKPRGMRFTFGLPIVGKANNKNTKTQLECLCRG